MYTEKQMKNRIHRISYLLWKKKGIDILLTHAPLAGCGDAPDLAHCGFQSFRDLLARYKPSYMVHGHVHANYSRQFTRERTYEDTKIINAYEKYIIEI